MDYWAYPENLVEIKLYQGEWGKKNFPHPNELLIWAYPENLVIIIIIINSFIINKKVVRQYRLQIQVIFC